MPKAKPKPKDPVKVDSKHYKVEAENKQVRVLRRVDEIKVGLCFLA